MIEVDLSRDLMPRHRDALRALGLLARKVPIDEWCLVGGMMVLVAARASGARLPRAEQTKDGDVVVDVLARPDAIAHVASELQGLGYELPAGVRDRADIGRCTFITGRSQIDVLCPDDARPDQLDTDSGIRSIAIPGGRRALELAEPVRIYYDDDAHDVEIRSPLIVGALVVKALAALDARTVEQHRHIQDVAALLSIVDDPIVLRSALGADRTTIAALVPRLTAGDDVAWDGLGPSARRQALATLRFLDS